MKNNDHPLTWFLSKKTKPLFSQAMVLELVPNITATTLQNWANREIVSALIHGGEQRGRRYYEGHQVIYIAQGSKLMDTFYVPPVEAMMMAMAATTEVLHKWIEDATAGATSDDQKMPIEIEWLSDYWAIVGRRAKAKAAKSADVGKLIQKSSLSLAWPHGRELIDLAVRAKAVYDERNT